MDAMKMAAFAVLSALTLMLLRRLKPEIGAVGALAAGALLLAFAFPFLRQVLEALGGLAQESGVRADYVTRLLKVTGVSLVMDLAAEACRDAGENGLAVKTELAGRMLLLALALPAMRQLLEQILSLAP